MQRSLWDLTRSILLWGQKEKSIPVVHFPNSSYFSFEHCLVVWKWALLTCAQGESKPPLLGAGRSLSCKQSKRGDLRLSAPDGVGTGLEQDLAHRRSKLCAREHNRVLSLVWDDKGRFKSSLSIPRSEVMADRRPFSWCWQRAPGFPALCTVLLHRTRWQWGWKASGWHACTVQ